MVKEKDTSLLASVRRTLMKHGMTSLLPPEETRPMLNRQKEDNAKARGKARASFREEDLKALGIKEGKRNFEFSVRDHSDATAKRAFRVQVPKRIIFYTTLVFFVLPVFLFIYVEMHKRSSSAADQKNRNSERYFSYDISKVLPHLMEEEVADSLLQNGTSTTPGEQAPQQEKEQEGSDQKVSDGGASKNTADDEITGAETNYVAPSINATASGELSGSAGLNVSSSDSMQAAMEKNESLSEGPVRRRLRSMSF
jgi:hypothetical protein